MNAHTIDKILDLHVALELQLGSFRSFVPGRTVGLLYRRERERERWVDVCMSFRRNGAENMKEVKIGKSKLESGK